MASGEEERGPSVAVAVSGRRSRPAVIWAAQNLFPRASAALLLHVVPSLSPASDQLAEQANRRDNKVQALHQILPFKKLCGPENQVEIVLLDGENPTSALLGYIAAADIENLVLGGSSLTWLKRVLKKPDVATSCLQSAQSSCNIFVVSRSKITAKVVNNSVTNVEARVDYKRINGYDASACGIGSCQALYSLSWRHLICSLNGSKAVDQQGSLDSFKEIQPMLLNSASESTRSEDLRVAENARLELQSTLATYDEVFEGLLAQSGSKSADLEEIDSLRRKLQVTLAMYDKACERLTHSKLKVQKLSEEWLDKSQRVKDAMLREEVLKRIVAEERRKHSEAVNEVKQAREILEKEVAERIKAEDHANEQSKEKMKLMETILDKDKGYKRYSKEEIAAATDNFSPEKKIGQGGFGSVYKGVLDHTHVAVKVLRKDAAEKMEEFMREVAVLSRLHHPNIVLLLGACTEIGCIVYEYMENGSLQDNLFPRSNSLPLPCHVRFRILFHVARALSFLHSSSPSPIIHRDLKPDNILLSRCHVAKISDVGLAKFAPDPASEMETIFRETIVAGTIHYVDPEYQRTGTLRPKSDLYAFGVICMQMLTGRSPAGVIAAVEQAMRGRRVGGVLDPAAGEWPVAAAEGLAAVALRCCEMKCRDRPELEAEVLPELERLLVVADEFALTRGAREGPHRFLCPILQEPMENPHIASDGFTYEFRAISAWLEENHTSPVTGLPLPDKSIIPNHSLRLAIQG